MRKFEGRPFDNQTPSNKNQTSWSFFPTDFRPRIRRFCLRNLFFCLSFFGHPLFFPVVIYPPKTNISMEQQHFFFLEIHRLKFCFFSIAMFVFSGDLDKVADLSPKNMFGNNPPQMVPFAGIRVCRFDFNGPNLQASKMGVVFHKGIPPFYALISFR